MSLDEIEQLRRLVIQRIAASSLRQVAREVGMSPTGLQKVANGSAPYQKTLLKLRSWRVRRSARDAQPIDADDAESALMLLTLGLAEESRRETGLEALEVFERAYAEEPPVWLAAVRERWLAPSESAQSQS